jgi:hypothetical protein
MSSLRSSVAIASTTIDLSPIAVPTIGLGGDRESEEASDRSALGSYSERSLALLKQLRVDLMNGLEESDIKGYLSVGFMEKALPILQIPKVSRPISVNYRIMSLSRSYTDQVG